MFNFCVPDASVGFRGFFLGILKQIENSQQVPWDQQHTLRKTKTKGSAYLPGESTAASVRPANCVDVSCSCICTGVDVTHGYWNFSPDLVMIETYPPPPPLPHPSPPPPLQKKTTQLIFEVHTWVGGGVAQPL